MATALTLPDTIQLTGRLALLALGGSVASGVVLCWHYLPTPALAHASLVDLQASSPLGASMRALHQLCSHLALGVGLLHLTLTLAGPAAPRSWRPGLIALGLIGALAFSGRVLPWDQHAAASLQMTEAFAGLAAPGHRLPGPGVADGIGAGAHTLWRVLVLHLLGAAALALALLIHGAFRRLVRDQLSRRTLTLAAGVVLALLAAATIAGPSALGPPQLAGAPPPAEVTAEWYLRWAQWLALRDVNLARATVIALALLVLGSSTLGRRAPRALRLSWVAALALGGLTSLLPGG